MNRPLVITSEGARHPFRRALPAHVTNGTSLLKPARSSDQDWKLFILSFAAFFTAFYAYLF